MSLFLLGTFGESPFHRLENLLASSKLELSTTDGFNNLVAYREILGTDRDPDLTNIDTSGSSNGL
jgi:hypothetical protein